MNSESLPGSEAAPVIVEGFQEGVEATAARIEAILRERGSALVAIPGKTGAGKTSFANALRTALQKRNIASSIVSTDDYYKQGTKSELNLEQLHQTIQALQRGEEVGHLTPAPVLLVEGLQTIDDAVVGQRPDLRAYLETPFETRIPSRLVRDERSGYRPIKDALETFARIAVDAPARIQHFEKTPDLSGVDLVIRVPPGREGNPELFISGDLLTFSVDGRVKEAVRVTTAQITALMQLGVIHKQAA